jgi:hypothetical protein
MNSFNLKWIVARMPLSTQTSLGSAPFICSEAQTKRKWKSLSD